MVETVLNVREKKLFALRNRSLPVRKPVTQSAAVVEKGYLHHRTVSISNIAKQGVEVAKELMFG